MSNRKFNLCWTRSTDGLELVQYEYPSWSAVVDYIKQNSIICNRKEGAHLFNMYGIRKINDPLVQIAPGKQYPRRVQANILTVHGMQLDLDEGGVTIEWIRKEFAAWNYLLYSSFNHKNPTKGRKCSYRLVLPFLIPVTYDKADYDKSEWSQRIEILKKQWTPYAGQASFTVPQAAYFPSYPQDRKQFKVWEINEGGFFDFLAIEPQAKEEKRGRPVSSLNVIHTVPIGNDKIITLADNRNTTLTNLYNELPATDNNDIAYDNRVGCYSINRPTDKNPSCFIFRQGFGLYFKDNIASKAVYIPIVEEMKGLPKIKRGKQKATIVEDIKIPQKPIFDKEFYDVTQPKLSRKEQRDLLQDWVNNLSLGRNILQTNEGLGKSYIIMFLLAQKPLVRKIIFCCVSTKQAREKYEDFLKWFSDKKFWQDNLGYINNQPKILWLYSKACLFTDNTGIKVIRKVPKDKFDPFQEADFGDVDENATKEFIKKQPLWKLIEQNEKITIDEWWEREYTNLPEHAQSEIYGYDIVVTTFARAEIFSKYSNKGRGPNLGREWVVIYDDPTIGQLQRLYPLTDKLELQILRHKEMCNHHAKTQPAAEPLAPLNIPEKYEILLSENEDKQKSIYFVKPVEECLGNHFKQHTYTDTQGVEHPDVINPIIFNTTEHILVDMLKKQELVKNSTKIFTELRRLDAPNLHCWGTKMVYKKNHELIEPMINRINVDYELDIEWIANGVGAALNHTTALGNNQLKEKDIIVKISNIPLSVYNKIYAELRYIGYNYTPKQVELMMLIDITNQLAGRNQGYRDSDHFMLMLISNMSFKELIESKKFRYKPVLTGQIDKVERDDGLRQELVKWYEQNDELDIPWAGQLIKWLREPETF